MQPAFGSGLSTYVTASLTHHHDVVRTPRPLNEESQFSMRAATTTTTFNRTSVTLTIAALLLLMLLAVLQ